MKSFGLVAPLLAGSAAARAMLDARALIGVDGSGAVCPMARSDTVLVQPIFYSEFIPYNTVIDPFRNGRPVTVNNAPTPIIVLSDFRTTILGGSVTIPTSNAVTTPATTTSGSVTITHSASTSNARGGGSSTTSNGSAGTTTSSGSAATTTSNGSAATTTTTTGSITTTTTASTTTTSTASTTTTSSSSV